MVEKLWNSWRDRGAADGFTVFVESLPQFAEHIVPLLWERGVHRREYTGTTLLENFGQHAGRGHRPNTLRGATVTGPGRPAPA